MAAIQSVRHEYRTADRGRQLTGCVDYQAAGNSAITSQTVEHPSLSQETGDN